MPVSRQTAAEEAGSKDASRTGSSLRPSLRRRRRRASRRGAFLVEFAFVAPVLILLIIGLFEFGRLIMVQQILTNASREGARRAIVEQSTKAEVETTITDYLSDRTISGATVTVTPDPLSSVGFGDPVSVTISVPYDQVSWLPTPRFLSGKQVTAQSVMCGERSE